MWLEAENNFTWKRMQGLLLNTFNISAQNIYSSSFNQNEKSFLPVHSTPMNWCLDFESEGAIPAGEDKKTFFSFSFIHFWTYIYNSKVKTIWKGVHRSFHFSFGCQEPNEHYVYISAKLWNLKLSKTKKLNQILTK